MSQCKCENKTTRSSSRNNNNDGGSRSRRRLPSLNPAAAAATTAAAAAGTLLLLVSIQSRGGQAFVLFPPPNHGTATSSSTTTTITPLSSACSIGPLGRSRSRSTTSSYSYSALDAASTLARRGGRDGGDGGRGSSGGGGRGSGATRRTTTTTTVDRNGRIILNKNDNRNNNKAGGGSSLTPPTTIQHQHQQQPQKLPNNNNSYNRVINLEPPMPIVGYDMDSINRYYDRRPFHVGWRLNTLGLPLLGWYLGLVTDKVLGVAKMESVERKRGEELRNHLINSGSVALVKSGQALSLRPDLLRNKIWAEELGKLVDAVTPFSDIEAMKIIRMELSDLVPRINDARKRQAQVAVLSSSSSSSSSQQIRLGGVSGSSTTTMRNGRSIAASGGGGGGRSRPTGLVVANAKDNKSPMMRKKTKVGVGGSGGSSSRTTLNKIQKQFQNDPVLSLFDFTNDQRAVASASIGQVYKATLRRGPILDAAIGKKDAARWGGKTVSIKVQRPDVAASAALDMYLLRRAAEWLSKFRGGDLPAIADQFGMQLFGELDYVREAHNGERFKTLYGDWDSVTVPSSCTPLTRKKVLVTEWIDGVKGPWPEGEGIDMVRIGLQCSVDQLLHTGVFHADPHRGNLLRTPEGKLGFLDFGMMADVPEEDRYGLIGLVIGLQNKDLPLVTENLLKLGFLKDTTQLDILVPRLRQALLNASGGTGKASNVNFAHLQAELDDISRDNVLQFNTPPFFTIIIRSLTILEGLALSVDSNFRLVRGAYPYVLAQLLSLESEQRSTPASLTKLLTYLLTVNGEGKRIEWVRLRDFLRLAKKAATKSSSGIGSTTNDGSSGGVSSSSSSSSRQTVDLFFRFLTSKAGLFLKVPLVHELAEAIDGMASVGEANLLRISRGLIRPLPGGLGPVNPERMQEIRGVFEIFRSAMLVDGQRDDGTPPDLQMEAMIDILQDVTTFLRDEKESGPVLSELASVIQMVAVEVLEIRGSRALRTVFNLVPGGGGAAAR